MSQTMTQPASRSPVRGKDTVTVLREVMSEQLGDPQAVEQFIENVARLCQAGAMKPIQIGNTVFLAQHYTANGQQMLPPGAAEIHMFSAEPFSETVKRISVLPNTMRELGYRSFTSYVLDKEMADLLLQIQRRIGIQGQIRQDMQYMDGEMTPVYRVEAIL